MNVVLDIIGLHDQPSFTDIKDFTSKTVDMFSDGTFDELYIYYSHYVNAIKYDVTEKKLLPFTDMNLLAENDIYEFEPSAEEILEVLLPQYAESLIYGAVIR